MNMTFESLQIRPGENSAFGSVNFNAKAGLAQMLKGGVIMDVVNAEQVVTVSPRGASFSTVLTSPRQESQKKLAHAQSWLWNECQPIFEREEALPACQTPR